MKLLLWIAISFLPGLIGAQFKPGPWYTSIPKAPWTPPNLMFPIVWNTLYLLIGVAAWNVFRDGIAGKKIPLILFVAHLLLNAAWSWIFFGQHRVGWALLELVLLFAVVIAMIVFFREINPAAGGLLIPYALWLCVALSLNGYTWFHLSNR